MINLHPSFEELMDALYDAVFVARRYYIGSNEEHSIYHALREFRPVLEQAIRDLESFRAEETEA